MTSNYDWSGVEFGGPATGSPQVPSKPKTHNGDLRRLPPIFAPYFLQRIWTGWNWTWKSEKAKWDKPPFMPDGVRHASSADPNTWCTYEEAMVAYEAGRIDGIGICLRGLMNGEIFVDLDDCRDPASGEISVWAKAIIDEANSYTEITVSGEGLRVIGRGATGPIGKRFGKRPDGSSLEFYAAGDGRYMTVSGNQQPGPWSVFGDISQLAKLLIENGGELEAPAQGSQTSSSNGHANGGSHSANAGQSTGSSFFRNANDAALANIEKWVKKLFATARYQPGTKAWRVSSKDLSRNLEEDISIHPSGIQDFGEEKAATAIDLVMKFGGAPDVTKAAMWLCEAMGLDPATLGWSSHSQRESTMFGTKASRGQGGEQGAGEAGSSSGQAKADPTHPMLRFREHNENVTLPRMIVPGFIAAGICVIAGYQGIGKTSAVLPLAALVAHIHTRLNDPLQPRHWRNVIYITEDRDQVDRILVAIANGDSYATQRNKERFKLVDAYGMTPDQFVEVGSSYVSMFTRVVDGVSIPPLVVIDTKSAAFAIEDENSNAEASAIMRALKTGFTGLPTWVIGHIAKANMTRSNASEMSLRGASAFEADANQVVFLVMQKGGGNEQRYLVRGKTRFEARWKEIAITTETFEKEVVDEFGDPGILILRRAAFEPLSSGERQRRSDEVKTDIRDADAEKREQAILKAVREAREAGAGIGKERIATIVGGKKASVVAAIRDLAEIRWSPTSASTATKAMPLSPCPERAGSSK